MKDKNGSSIKEGQFYTDSLGENYYVKIDYPKFVVRSFGKNYSELTQGLALTLIPLDIDKMKKLSDNLANLIREVENASIDTAIQLFS